MMDIAPSPSLFPPEWVRVYERLRKSITFDGTQYGVYLGTSTSTYTSN